MNLDAKKGNQTAEIGCGAVDREEYRMPTGTQGGMKKKAQRNGVGVDSLWTPQGLEGVGLGPSIVVSE